MDAPLYPPAVAFELPARIAGKMSSRDSAIIDLKQNPAAWAIVTKEIPILAAVINSDGLKPHLGNFSLRSLIPFGVFKPDALDRIDTQLLALEGTR